MLLTPCLFARVPLFCAVLPARCVLLVTPAHVLPPLTQMRRQVENLGVPEALELKKLRLLKEELGELAAHGAQGSRLVAVWCSE